jgi:hypothetical protein
MPKQGAKNPKPEPGTPQSPPPTGCEVGGRTVRGPDLVPRRELVRRIFERALWGTQMRSAFDPVTGLPRAKGKRCRSEARWCRISSRGSSGSWKPATTARCCGWRS